VVYRVILFNGFFGLLYCRMTRQTVVCFGFDCCWEGGGAGGRTVVDGLTSKNDVIGTCFQQMVDVEVIAGREQPYIGTNSVDIESKI
jgi:hypothetical protein